MIPYTIHPLLQNSKKEAAFFKQKNEFSPCFPESPERSLLEASVEAVPEILVFELGGAQRQDMPVRYWKYLTEKNGK